MWDSSKCWAELAPGQSSAGSSPAQTPVGGSGAAQEHSHGRIHLPLIAVSLVPSNSGLAWTVLCIDVGAIWLSCRRCQGAIGPLQIACKLAYRWAFAELFLLSASVACAVVLQPCLHFYLEGFCAVLQANKRAFIES